MIAVLGWLLTLLCLLTQSTHAQSNKTKRQIYREQVLPLSGGKIPDGAFRADRLALNRLNKEGIAVPDGVLLEHRSVHSHPHINKHDPEDEDQVLKIIQQSETRYAPAEGQYHNEHPLTVSSTYLIRRPIGRQETNIRTPDQQRPHHKALLYKNYDSYLPSYRYQPPKYQGSPSPPQPQPPPSPPRHQNRYPSSYSHTEHKPQLYHPIPVPFELPNKEIEEERYYLKQHENSYPQGPPPEEISGRIDWSQVLDSYERLPSDLSNFLPPSGYEFESPSYNFYNSPESLGSFDGITHFFGDRFVRKSAEGHAKGVETKRRASSDRRTSSRTFSRRVGQAKCSSSANSKCHVY